MIFNEVSYIYYLYNYFNVLYNQIFYVFQYIYVVLLSDIIVVGMDQFFDINYIEFFKYRNQYFYYVFLLFFLINLIRIYVVVYNIDVYFN